MKLHQMISSNIEKAGYDDKKKTLEIHFMDGSAYQYRDVPKVHYEGLFKAESAGKFLRKWIIKGGYPVKKIT